MFKRCVLLIFCCYSSAILAFSWNDLWLNKFHQGVKRYRVKDYQAATDLFSRSDNAQSNYNRGNALAFSKKYQEALQAYDKALKLNSKMADARYNREIVKKLLEQQKKQQKNQKKSENKKKNQKQQPKKDKQQAQKKKDQQKKKKQENQQAKVKKQEPKKQKPKKQKKIPQTAQQKRETRKNREKNQSEKQLLNNIPDDPGGLLRRKFKRDYERRQMEANRW